MKTAGLRLRTRLALWMLASAGLSLVAFAAIVYALVSLEEWRDLAPESPPETPSEIATETAEEVLLAMALAAPVALLITVGSAVWISRRTLSPLRAVVRAADEMGTRDLHRRLRVPSGDPELAELVAALNQLFERLESGFAALERYAADASHELRTPLAVLAAELEVALRHERSPDQWQQTATNALDEVRRLTRLVETLLALARLDTRPLPDVEHFDLEQAVDQSLSPVRWQIEAARLSLSIATGERTFVVRGDADAFATALTSLLANAVRYTPPGGLVRVSIAEGPEGRVDVHVDDSGPGVPISERQAIFEPFGRGSAGRAADDRDASESGGLGLGLALVRRVVEQQGGSVTVGASPLGGARFTLQLPTAST